MIKIADFTKTSGSWWHIEDSLVNVAAALHKEHIKPEHVIMTRSDANDKVFCFVYRPVPI